jgi:hypothetical protein
MVVRVVIYRRSVRDSDIVIVPGGLDERRKIVADESNLRSCPECEAAGEKRMFQASGLGSHRRIKHGVAGSSQKSVAYREYQARHGTATEKISCDICGRKLSRRSMTAHKRLVHGIRTRGGQGANSVVPVPIIADTVPITFNSPLEFTFKPAKDLIALHCSDGSVWIAQKVIS